MIRLWGNSKRYMKLETEKTYITHIKSLKVEGWVEAEREREGREREKEREKGGIWRLYYWNSISKSK